MRRTYFSGAAFVCMLVSALLLLAGLVLSILLAGCTTQQAQPPTGGVWIQQHQSTLRLTVQLPITTLLIEKPTWRRTIQLWVSPDITSHGAYENPLEDLRAVLLALAHHNQGFDTAEKARLTLLANTIVDGVQAILEAEHITLQAPWVTGLPDMILSWIREVSR